MAMELSGSLNISGSLNVSNGITGPFNATNNVVSSSAQLINLLPTNILSGSSQVEFNSISNTPFSQSVNEVTTTKSIVPSTTTLDLGTPEKPFRDLYLSSASLYIDGQQVISSNASELVITTDNGQSIKLFEQGADDIILQTEDGNIELKGTIEVQTGKKIIDSGGTEILFGDSIGITGSISLTGTVDGVDVSGLKSDFDTLNGKTLVSGSSQVSYVNLSNIPSGIVSGSSQITITESQISDLVHTDISSLNSYTSSLKNAISVDGQNVTIAGNFNVSGTQTIVDSTTVQIGDNIIELNGSGAANGGIHVKDATAPNTATGSLIWDSTNDLWKAGVKDSEVKVLLAQGDGVISGSSQVSFDGIVDKPTLVSGSSQVISILSSLNSYTSSNDTTNTTQNSRLTSLETKTGSLDTTNTTQNSRLTSIESATGSYETKGSGIVSGSSQVSYTGLSNIPSGIVSGSSQITLSSTTGYGSVINQAVLTSSSPTFAGGLFNGDVTSTSGYQGRYHRIYEASSQRGGMYTYNVISGGGTDYSIGLFSEGEFFIAPGGSATKKFTMSTSGNVTLSGTLTTTSHINSGGWFGAPNGYGVTATNAAGTAGRILIKLNSSNQIEIGNDSDISAIKLGTASTGDAIVVSSDGYTTIAGNLQIGSGANRYIRYRTQSAWDYYLKADSDDFVLYDSQSTEFFRAVYNGGGSGKYIKFLNALTAYNNTNVTVAGTLTENSSIRYKENIETIESGLDKVIQLRGVTYTKKDNGEKEMGLIAEEVYDVLPEVVLKNEQGEPDSVSYGRIVSVLIEGMKEQQKQIEDLKLEIQLLKQR